MLYHVSVCMIASLFLVSGINQALHWQGCLALMQDKGLPFVRVGLVAMILLKLIASLMLIFTYHVQFASGALMIFVVVATLLFHNYWKFQGLERVNHYHSFLSNVCIVGALLLVMAR